VHFDCGQIPHTTAGRHRLVELKPLGHTAKVHLFGVPTRWRRHCHVISPTST